MSGGCAHADADAWLIDGAAAARRAADCRFLWSSAALTGGRGSVFVFSHTDNGGFMNRFGRGVLGVLLGLAGLCSASQAAFASSASMGYIVEVFGTHNGAVLFSTTGTISGARPGCQGPGLTHRYAIDASTVAGQAAVALLMTAKAQGKRIFINGIGACTIWGDTETIDFFVVED